jgi:hypothetical protein
MKRFNVFNRLFRAEPGQRKALRYILGIVALLVILAISLYLARVIAPPFNVFLDTAYQELRSQSLHSPIPSPTAMPGPTRTPLPTVTPGPTPTTASALGSATPRESAMVEVLGTACVTIMGGVSVLVVGQLATKFFIEPIHSHARLLGEIAHSLTFYANMYGQAGVFGDESAKEASKTLRQQASQLRASVWTIPLYRLWQLLRFVPKQDDSIKASNYLIGLSNSMCKCDYSTIDQRYEETKSLLRLR